MLNHLYLEQEEKTGAVLCVHAWRARERFAIYKGV